MQEGNSYIIGSTPDGCDIVFHDNSVSRQHAKVEIAGDGKIFIEDMGSKNFTYLSGDELEGRQSLDMNQVVSMGTTSFVVIDREGEMITVISPLMPEVVKTLQSEEKKKEEIEKKANVKAKEMSKSMNTLVIIGILVGFFALVSLSISSLFRSETVDHEQTVVSEKKLDEYMKTYPQLTYTFNKRDKSPSDYWASFKRGR